MSSTAKVGRHTKFGFCKRTNAWVPRDSMLGINVKAYNENNDEKRIQIRLSPEAWEQVVSELETIAWENNLKTESEIPDHEDVDIYE